jgi:hypothetical protein
MWKLRAAVTGLAIFALLVAFVAAIFGYAAIADLAETVAKFTCWFSSPGLLVMALGLRSGVCHDYYTRRTR